MARSSFLFVLFLLVFIVLFFLIDDSEATSSSSRSRSRSRSLSRTRTRSKSLSRTRTRSKSPSRTRSKSASRTRSRTKSISHSRTPARSLTRTRTPSKSISLTRTASKSISLSRTPLRSPTRSRTPSKSISLTRSPSRSHTRTRSPSKSRSYDPAVTELTDPIYNNQSPLISPSRSRSRPPRSPTRSTSSSLQRSLPPPLASIAPSPSQKKIERGAWIYPRQAYNLTRLIELARELELNYLLVSWWPGIRPNVELDLLIQELPGVEMRLMTMEQAKYAFSSWRTVAVTEAVNAAIKCSQLGKDICQEIHFDTEQYTLPEWILGNDTVKFDIMNQLNETLTVVRASVKLVDPDIRISAAISWWLEKKYPDIYASFPVDRYYKMVYGDAGLGETPEDVIKRIRSQPNTKPTMVGLGRRQQETSEEMKGESLVVELALENEEYFLGTSLFNLNLMEFPEIMYMN